MLHFSSFWGSPIQQLYLIFLGATLQHVYLFCAKQPTQPPFCQCIFFTSSSCTYLVTFFCPVTNSSFSLFPTLLHFRLFFHSPAFFPDLLRIRQWNSGRLRVKRVALLYFLSLLLVNIICIQKSNLNSFSSFQISG